MHTIVRCRGCGKEIHPAAKTCPSCGTPNMARSLPSMVYCHGCGKEIHMTARTCPSCGAPQPNARAADGISEKKILPAFLLCFFLGILGVHRFYVGKIVTGIIMLLLTITILFIFISSIWCLIDMITLILGRFTDHQGRRLADWN